MKSWIILVRGGFPVRDDQTYPLTHTKTKRNDIIMCVAALPLLLFDSSSFSLSFKKLWFDLTSYISHDRWSKIKFTKNCIKLSGELRFIKLYMYVIQSHICWFIYNVLMFGSKYDWFHFCLSSICSKKD